MVISLSRVVELFSFLAEDRHISNTRLFVQLGIMVAKDMLRTSFALLLALWLSVSDLDYAETRKVSKDLLTDCTNCTLCAYPCQPLPPPPALPVPDYPSHETPPPPLPGYLSPPSQASCPPVPVECCQHPPPYAYGYQPPPYAYGYQQPPPYPYGFQPQENDSTSRSPFKFISVIVLLSSIATCSRFTCFV